MARQGVHSQLRAVCMQQAVTPCQRQHTGVLAAMSTRTLTLRPPLHGQGGVNRRKDHGSNRPGPCTAQSLGRDYKPNSPCACHSTTREGSTAANTMSATARPERVPSAFARKVAVACVAASMLLCVLGAHSVSMTCTCDWGVLASAAALQLPHRWRVISPHIASMAGASSAAGRLRPKRATAGSGKCRQQQLQAAATTACGSAAAAAPHVASVVTSPRSPASSASAAAMTCDRCYEWDWFTGRELADA